LEEQLDRLCNLFEDELERQQTVLAVCRAKGAAVSANDVTTLEDRTAALELLIQETVGAEAERHEVLREIVKDLRLPAEGLSLTDLIALVRDPWQHRMAEFQQRIRETIRETQEVVEAYSRTLRHSARVNQDCMNLLFRRQDLAPGHYDASGVEPHAGHAMPALVDQKG
jgi:FlgN protein